MKNNHTFSVPATPGWFLSVPIFSDDGEVVDLDDQPIVAWIIEYNENGDRWRTAFPVSASSSVSESFDYAILQPDRTYDVLGLAKGLTKSEAIAAMNQ